MPPKSLINLAPLKSTERKKVATKHAIVPWLGEGKQSGDRSGCRQSVLFTSTIRLFLDLSIITRQRCAEMYSVQSYSSPFLGEKKTEQIVYYYCLSQKDRKEKKFQITQIVINETALHVLRYLARSTASTQLTIHKNICKKARLKVLNNQQQQ